MSEVYKVIYTGRMKLDADHQKLVALFSKKFKLGGDKAYKLIHGGKVITLKKSLERDKALKYKEVLEKLGMIIELDPKLEPEAATFPSDMALEEIGHDEEDTTEVLDPSTFPEKKCPKCGSSQMQMGICQDCGIVAAKYIALRANMMAEQANIDKRQDGDPYEPPEADLVEADDVEMVGPKGVPVRHVFSWISGGWQHFKESPLAWVGAIIVLAAVGFVVSMIPLLEAIAISLLSPTLVASFMMGCHEQEEGGQFSVSHLFAGFSQNVVQTLLLGVLYLLLFFMVVGGIHYLMFGSISGLMSGEAAYLNDTYKSFMSVSGMAMAGIGFIFVVSIMLFMANMFAPALVALDDLSAWQAMKMSFVGCLKNILPLIVYSIVAVLLLVLGALPVKLGLLVVYPILIGATYSAYRDIFFD
ncbi:MAG: BPSS1780 family membrane protein [Candidatus Thiodiazotropha sp.]|jgi:uncharacterized membrane protein